jgi:hypothetical protein
MVFLSEKRENDKLAALSKYIEKNYITKPWYKNGKVDRNWAF